MAEQAFAYGANIIAFEKNNKKYGMCCSWATQVDYERVMCLLGSQSVTGHKIKKGDIIGISALNENQSDIADKFGGSHSDEVDKFEGINYKNINGALLINGATRMMVVRVIDVMHVNEIEADNLIYGYIESIEKNDVDFMVVK